MDWNFSSSIWLAFDQLNYRKIRKVMSMVDVFKKCSFLIFSFRVSIKFLYLFIQYHVSSLSSQALNTLTKIQNEEKRKRLASEKVRFIFLFDTIMFWFFLCVMCIEMQTILRRCSGFSLLLFWSFKCRSARLWNNINVFVVATFF